MGRISDLKSGIRIAKKLKFEKPLTLAEAKFLKKEGLIKRTKSGLPTKTKKGREFIKRIDRLGFI